MDLIGNIKYIENRLGKRKPHHGAEKPAQKNTRSEAAGSEEDQTDTPHFPTDNETRLGRKVNTTA